MKSARRTLLDLTERQGDLLRNHATAHTSLRIKSGGLEVKDCPVYPLWQDYLNRIAELPAIGIARDYKPEEVSEKRILRCLISVMGYLKRIAALDCLLRGKETVSFGEALSFMDTRLLGISDAASWHHDVQGLIREMRFHHD
ncbi:MAG: hypothetical protein AB7S81_05490 [Bdellovibrionales bacterium]